MPVREEKLFIKWVNLKGFKSIENLTIDFEEGLNILIGKNASGKSNFLEGLFQVLSSHHTKTSYKYSKIKLLAPNNDSFIWETEKEIQSLKVEKENFEDRIKIKESLSLNEKVIFDNYLSDKKSSFIKYNGKEYRLSVNGRFSLRRLGFINIYPSYIRFNIPTSLDCIKIPGTIKIYVNDEDDIYVNIEDIETLGFIYNILWQIEFNYDSIDKINSLNKSSVLDYLIINDEIKSNLRKYSPIQDIKFNENINIYRDGKSVIIENLKIDFKVNNTWMPWSQLSDGTKRLFYIIAEVTSHERGIVFVEEPELGIHPHQFNLIMDFLKNQSIEKQIFISTHSPFALNHLTPHELNHILITYFDPKKGTQMKHLTSAQVKKARKYMKEVGFMSDYWMLSDLE